MRPWLQAKVSPAIVLRGCGRGSSASADPTGRVPASWRRVRASRTAPSTLSIPAPCSNRSGPFIIWAVYIRIALTMLGVREGLACRMRAAAPATTPADIDVPLSIMYRLFVLVPSTCRAG